MKIENVRAGQKVLVFDRYRFAVPLKATICSTSGCNDGILVLLEHSNNSSYPIGTQIWVHAQQLKRIKK